MPTDMAQLFRLACQYTPGGVHSNVRFAIQTPYPRYLERAKGPKVWDVEGRELIDCLIGMGAILLGHGDEDVLAAVRETLETGLTASVDCPLSIEVSRQLHRMIPCAERVRFCNSGTEAVMHAVAIARGYTGRHRIVKCEGNYHGYYDFVYASFRHPKETWDRAPQAVPACDGLSPSVLHETLVIPWNDLEALDRVLTQYRGEVAAFILEPVNYNIGCALPRPGYLEGVREITHKHGVLLIFDEIITGFRLAPGGAQERFGVVPDLATFGKAIANGFQLAALTGRSDVMDVCHPGTGRVAFSGTYNGHPVALAAASVVLEKVADGRLSRELQQKTDLLLREFEAAKKRLGVTARIQGIGGKFHVYFTEHEVYDYRTAFDTDRNAYKVFYEEMVRQGIYWSAAPFTHHGITTSHGPEELAKIQAAFGVALEAVRRQVQGRTP